MRVYVSSTYQDLVEYRQAVYDVLGRMRCEVVGMEHYVASDERPLDKCLSDVRGCDVYVGILAFRYGYVPAGHDRSITELEYQAGAEADRLMFLADEQAPWPRNQIEMGSGSEELERFRSEVKAAHVVDFFRTPDELAADLASSLHRLAEERLAAEVDGVRAEQAEADRADVDRRRQTVVNLPPVDVSWFCGRRREQAQLWEFIGDGRIRMVSVVGRPGIGKSALASRALVDMEKAREAGGPTVEVGGILYLSSHSTGLGLERLYADARRMLEPDVADGLAAQWSRQDATVSQKVDLLFDALRDSQVLVLLDGLEALLGDDGAIAEEGLRAFVERALIRAVGPRLMVTSRSDPRIPAQGLAAVRVIKLQPGLDPDDAVTLLRSLDPQNERGLGDAPDEDLGRAAELCGRIPRSLQALACILDADPAMTLTRLLADESSLRSRTVETLIGEGYELLADTERRVMHALAVLAQPVTQTPISYIAHTWFPGIDVAASLQRLTRNYFVSASRSTGEFTLQPMDCAHAYSRIPEVDEDAGSLGVGDVPPYIRRNLELRAAEFYATVRKPPAEWRSIDDLAPQLAEFRHRRQAGDVDGAIEVLNLIDPEHLFLWGHYTRIIELRQSLLDLPARPALQAANLGGLAMSCQVIGHYDAAIDYYERAVEAARASGEVGAETEYVGNLGRLYRNMGYIDRAISCSQAALQMAEEQADRRDEGRWCDRLGLAYASVGRLAEAAALHERAFVIADEFGDRRSRGATLSNLALVDQYEGAVARSTKRYEDALTIAHEIGDRRGVCIITGRLGALALRGGDSERAVELHKEALVLAQELGERREQSYQHLGIGRALLTRGDLVGAVERLRAARDLDMSETSYWASLTLALTLRQAQDDTAKEAFRDSVRRAEERLNRCDRLWGPLYALATATLGAGACASTTDMLPGKFLDSALEQYRRAVEICPARGVVANALDDVACLRASGVRGLETVTALLEDALGRGMSSP